MINRRAFLAGALSLAGCTRKAGAGFDGYVFVANEESRSVAVVDLAAFAIARHIPLPAAPTAIIGHPTKALVYVLTPSTGTIHEIDSLQLKVLRQVQVAPSLLEMRLAPTMDAIWALAQTKPKLVRIDLEAMKVANTVSLQEEPQGFDLAKETQLAAVAYRGSGRLALIDLTSDRPPTSLKVADAVGSVRFRADGKALLIADVADSRLTVLETPSGKTVTRLPLAVRPDHLCFNNDGGQLFITGAGRDAVVVVYPYYLPRVAETVLAGNAPGSMAASDTHLFVANPNAGDVTVLNIQRRKVVAVAGVGALPSHISITPNNQYALVLNSGSGDMAVIRTAAIVPDRRRAAGLFTMIPVGSKPVSAVVKALS